MDGAGEGNASGSWRRAARGSPAVSSTDWAARSTVSNSGRLRASVARWLEAIRGILRNSSDTSGGLFCGFVGGGNNLTCRTFHCQIDCLAILSLLFMFYTSATFSAFYSLSYSFTIISISAFTIILTTTISHKYQTSYYHHLPFTMHVHYMCMRGIRRCRFGCIVVLAVFAVLVVVVVVVVVVVCSCCRRRRSLSFSSSSW
jgi:hypothetical protein